MINTPLLSILIATRNREEYCKNAILSILENKETNFELVVQDNSDSNDLKTFCKKIFDTRLVYNYTPPPFSSIDNFNAVIGLAKGEYLCLIGDDDGINPEIFKVVRWANKNNIDSIVPALSAIYWWPGATKNIEARKDDNGIIEIARISGEISLCDTTNVASEVMRTGGQNYLNLNFPKLYHGIVKREFMNLIKANTGYFVGGLSPDIYISIALTSFIKKIVKIDYPLTLAGICIASTSADAANQKNTGKLEDAPHFRDRGPYSWAKQVPNFYSGVNIWADSAIASITDMKRYEVLKKFNVTALSVHLLKRHIEYRDLILENYFVNKNATGAIKKKYYLKILKFKPLQYWMIDLLQRATSKISYVVLNKGKHIINEPENIRDVRNISEATSQLVTHLSKTSLSIDRVLDKMDITSKDY